MPVFECPELCSGAVRLILKIDQEGMHNYCIGSELELLSVNNTSLNILIKIS